MKAGSKVFVGLSGGVDSSTAAYLLQRTGHDVTGVYMKNWAKDVAGHQCPWRQDYLAAKDLAAFLGIEFLVFDFQKEYKQLVVDHMVEQYRAGYTPNPDIRCNQEIKFKLFFKACLDKGANQVATGHYARVGASELHQARDQRKDQTYFLYRLEPAVLPRLVLPLGNHLKTGVRTIASRAGLPNADRPESMGICFVGEIGLADFLKQYVKAEPGPILADGRVVGQHQGAIFYTFGQRRGLNVGGGPPYYVVGKDMDRNEVHVSRDLEDRALWCEQLALRDTHWLLTPSVNKFYNLRLRHGGKLVGARVNRLSLARQTADLKLSSRCRAAAPGQSAVLYDQTRVVGGGIIAAGRAKA